MTRNETISNIFELFFSVSVRIRSELELQKVSTYPLCIHLSVTQTPLFSFVGERFSLLSRKNFKFQYSLVKHNTKYFEKLN